MEIAMRVSLMLWAGMTLLLPRIGSATPLSSFTVGQQQAAGIYQAEAQLEAARQSTIAAQVPGQILLLGVRAGDHVRKGQILVRLDDAAAMQNAGASRALIGAASAQLNLAMRDYQRQQQLFADGYISQAALDRSRAQYQAARAATSAQASQAGAAYSSARHFTLQAPYAAVVATVAASQGEMAMPGQRLLSIYDPSAMKVVASVPQSLLPHLHADTSASILIGSRTLRPVRVTVSPGADPASHTVEIRLDLPAQLGGLTPGTFARVAFLNDGQAAAGNLRIPARAVVRHSEITGVYIISRTGRPLLRQVRTSRPQGQWVEVLSGLSAGEVIALDPLAAARITGE